jgi:cytochrome c oxidase cbb3-type subunit 3
MIAWKKQLNPLQIQLVSSYVITLKGTTPANPKAPQGVKEGTQQAGL